MGDVIHVDVDTMYTMNRIRESMKWYGKNSKFQRAKDKEKNLYDYFMKGLVEKKEAA